MKRLASWSDTATAGAFGDRLFLSGAIVAVAVAFIGSMGGIHVGTSNHTGLLPVVRQILDPEYLPGDFNIQLRWHHHKPFALLVAAFSKAMGEETALVTLNVLGKLALASALWVFCRAVGLGKVGFLLTGLMVAAGITYAGRGLEWNTFVGNPEVQPPIFAHAFLLLALAWILEKRLVVAAFALGVATLFHVQVGILFSLIVLPFYFYWQSPAVHTGSLFLMFLAWSVPAFPALWPLIAAIGDGGMDDVWDLDYLHFRMPHHFELASTEAAIWFSFHLAVLGLAFMVSRSRGDERANKLLVLLVTAVLIAAASAIHFLDYHILRWGWFAKLQAIRLTPLVTVFGAAALIILLESVWANRNAAFVGYGHRQSLAAVFGIGMAIGVSLAMHTGGLWGRWSLSAVVAGERPGDWEQICQYIKDHTPREATFLTPPGIGGFTYLSDRSTVVDFKINPDGARFLGEWKARLADLAGGVLPQGRGFENTRLLNDAYFSLTPDKLLLLGKKYNASFAVVGARNTQVGETVYTSKRLRLVALPLAD